MKLHRNLALAIVEGLKSIFTDNEPAQYAIPRLVKQNHRWGSRDRRLVAQILYDIVRWKRLYAVTMACDSTREIDYWRLLACWIIRNEHPLPDWPEWTAIDPTTIQKNYLEACKQKSVEASMPDWLYEAGKQAFGTPFWEKESTSLNQTAPLVIRVNNLKTHLKALQHLLKHTHNIESKAPEGYPHALVLEKELQLKQSKAYQNGLFEIQDANSQKVAMWLAPKPGMTVIDACAGAGGKTMHLAALMQNKGKLIALDVSQKKLDELKKRATRNGVTLVETSRIEKENTQTALEASADRVLVDVPCSGLGVLKRYPDTKWKMNPEKIKNLIIRQKQILQYSAHWVKPNGLLVYATCSIFPNENQEQINAFLNSHDGKDFERIKEKTFFAHQTGFDGFYIALLKRKHVDKSGYNSLSGQTVKA